MFSIGHTVLKQLPWQQWRMTSIVWWTRNETLIGKQYHIIISHIWGHCLGIRFRYLKVLPFLPFPTESFSNLAPRSCAESILVLVEVRGVLFNRSTNRCGFFCKSISDSKQNSNPLTIALWNINTLNVNGPFVRPLTPCSRHHVTWRVQWVLYLLYIKTETKRRWMHM